MMMIDEKYFLLLGKIIYNKRLDKIGYISALEISQIVSLSYGISFIGFYDDFDNNEIIFMEDFEKGDIQFVLITNYLNKDKELENIKTVFEDKFSDDMIIYMTEEEKALKYREVDKRNTQMLFHDLISLTDISAEAISDDFYSRELYLKYKKEDITKEELLYALVNHLAQELKKINDSNRNYFVKYELLNSLDKGWLKI